MGTVRELSIGVRTMSGGCLSVFLAMVKIESANVRTCGVVKMTGNVADLLRRVALEHPGAPALISDSGRWTWEQLDRAADVGAAALAARGLRARDLALVHLPTGPELAVALFAVARADLVAVPVDPHRDASEIVDRLRAAVVLTADPGELDRALVLGVPEITAWFDVVGPRVEPSSGGEDIAILARASRGGRAVMLSHRAVLASVAAIVAAPGLRLRTSDRVLLVLPLFHLAGFVTAFLPLTTVGAAAVIAETPPVTGPNVAGTGAWIKYSSAVLSAVHDHRVTVIPGAPPLYRLLLRSTRLERSLATVRLMTSAASPLAPQDGAAIRARTGSPVWEGYGVSEAASAVASTLMTAAPRSGSVGLPLAGVEIRIEAADDALALELDDDSLASLEADADPGPISIRAPQLFSGYWPDGADGPDAGGWFTTSDLGYIDSRGELHLIDRQAETIAITGFTVYPREVESALISHPFVRDAAVIGLPGRSGAELAAAVVPVHGTAPTADDLTEHLGQLLPAFKRPVRYRIVPILPRTELGRLDRDAVRADWADADGIELADATGGARLSVVADPAGSGNAAQRSADRAGRADPTSETKAEPDSPEVQMTTPESTPAPTPAPAEPPEVIEVSQLDQLGSRLPGVSGRSRRSALDTDSDLFGEEIFDPEPREADPE